MAKSHYILQERHEANMNVTIYKQNNTRHCLVKVLVLGEERVYIMIEA